MNRKKTQPNQWELKNLLYPPLFADPLPQSGFAIPMPKGSPSRATFFAYEIIEIACGMSTVILFLIGRKKIARFHRL